MAFYSQADFLEGIDLMAFYPQADCLALRDFNAGRLISSFSQRRIIWKLDKEKDRELYKINSRFNGLCELVCNQVLKDDLLGKAVGVIKRCVTKESLSDSRIVKSHILEIHSFVQRIFAFFRRYPDNMLSWREQTRLVSSRFCRNREINREILKRALNSIEPNKMIKVEVFERKLFKVQGHSLLVKKIDEGKFNFFDPDIGEYGDLSLDQLADKIQVQFSIHRANDLLLIKGDDYLRRMT